MRVCVRVSLISFTLFSLLGEHRDVVSYTSLYRLEFGFVSRTRVLRWPRPWRGKNGQLAPTGVMDGGKGPPFPES